MKTPVKSPGCMSRLFALSAAAIGFWSQAIAVGEIQFEPATDLISPGVNGDGAPSLSRDGLTLYFEATRSGGLGLYDLWMATRSSRFGVFGTPVNLGSNVNSSSNDRGPSISSDGLSLYFNSNRPAGSGPNDLYVATRATTNDQFGIAVNLGAGINSSSNEAQPDISADGLTILFQSNRPGTLSDQDLYMATRLTTSLPFGTVVNLGPTINSFAWQGSASLSADKLRVFSTRDFAAGAGNDIMVSTRALLSDPWGQAVELGPNVNGPFDEDFADIAWDGLSIVFASNRNFGDWRLYEARTVPPPFVVLVNHPGSGPPTAAGYPTLITSVSATDPHFADPNAQGNRAYDAFNLSPVDFPEGADIRRFNWEMAVGGEDRDPGPLQVTSYRVEFWENQKPPGQRDQPGASLFSVNIPAAAVRYQSEGISALPNNSGVVNYAFYHVSVDLPESFHAAPGRSYWVSWVAMTPTFQPAYSWFGDLSGGQVWQDRVDRNMNLVLRLDRQDRNLFWTLEGTATPPGFAAWIAGYGLTGPNAAPDADPDLDGMPNSLEYVLGGNPTVSSTAGLPTASRASGNFVFTFNRADASETPDVALVVQAGPDLVNWPTVYTIGPDTASSSVGVSITEIGAAPDTITVSIPQGTEAIKFARLTVTVTP